MTFIMITDTVLQDTTKYPNWCVCGKRIWNEACGGFFRVIFVWIIVAISTGVIFGGILFATEATNLVADMSDGAVSGMWSNELSRAALVCVIAMVDLFIVFQVSAYVEGGGGGR
jgi:hypothetical protein